MKKILATLGLASMVFVSSATAQSFAFVGEVGQLLNATGNPVNSTAVDAFYAVTPSGTVPSFVDALAPTPEEVAAAISDFSWLPLVDGAPAGADFMTPDVQLGALVSIAVGEQPIFAFFDSVATPTEVAVLSGAPFLSNLDNRFITISSGNFSILSGAAGSVQMVSVVPEPSTFALLGGVLALGFVMYRRRRA
ncbi:PEP-CTERM sorting domain-containing protein [Puniceicoccales bacterium CK1056]|uniref:PEP-CTERM sorting domain-containing protein n=1 Tax=Oceanipulchritudo coccoides TaxID=2706888 RepID=A0A6B2LYS3_9BACT|nr:PEP-CTERM sorting domain-containing protein [Oceanipulchritudo coccoides]NDV61768.1 PEP-CTERM sorting domain-containing protein [Oceanipulchritudo coccoides]